jgi:uncharacterized membrane protein
MQRTQKVALTAVFAAMHTILYLPEGPWRSFVIYLIPIEGIILGPPIGVSSALLGSSIARLIKPTPDWMFGVIAEPIGVLVAALLAKGKWKEVTLTFGFMLAAFFAHPYGRMLPLWAMLDVFTAFILIYPASRVGARMWENRTEFFVTGLVLVSFVSTVADSLTRVFMFIPAGFSQVLGLPYETLIEIYIVGAVGSYIEDLLVVMVTLIVGVPLLVGLKKVLKLDRSLS